MVSPSTHTPATPEEEDDDEDEDNWRGEEICNVVWGEGRGGCRGVEEGIFEWSRMELTYRRPRRRER